MIIVLFHVLYMIGKMVYNSYHSNKRKDFEEDTQESEKPANFSNKRHATDPFAEDNYVEHESPRFSPPAYIQRYTAVQKVLADPQYQGKIKKVVDFGCSELGFLNHLKNTLGIEEILCVDVDRDTLERHRFKAIPLNADYLHKRPNPLTIHVYEGSVTERDKILANSDAVVAIELIEHLYPDTLMDLPHNIFGYIKPLVVAVTTPNAEFNVLFNFVGNQMRHWDHKFEWTRQQFEDWSNNIVTRYPEYRVSFQGIGSGAEGTENLGCCSQMAVFTRTRDPESLTIYGIEGLFKSVTSEEYPYTIDNRSDEQKILDEVSYHIRRFTQNNHECLEEYPMTRLLSNLEQFNISAEMIREILENGGYTVVDRDDGAAILCPALSTFSDYEEDPNDIDDEFEGEWDHQRLYYRDNLSGDVEMAHDDECWDDDFEIPAHDSQAHEEIDLSLTRSLDTAELNTIEISNISHVPSVPDSIEADNLSNFAESFESNDDKSRAEISVDKKSLVSKDLSVQCKIEDTFESSVSVLSETNSSSVYAIAENLDDFSSGLDDTMERLGSLCSMYLESSRNEDREVCPENITNPSFDCTALECSFELSKDSVDSSSPSVDRSVSDLQILTSKRLTSTENRVSQPQFTSSPRISLEHRLDSEKSKSEKLIYCLKSISQGSLQSNESSSTTTSSGSSLSTLRKWYPPEENSIYRKIDAIKLKGGNEITDEPNEEITSESGEVSSSESLESNNIQEILHVTRVARQNAPESLELGSTTSSKIIKESLTIIDSMPSTCRRVNTSVNTVQMPHRVDDSIMHNVDETILVASTHKSNPGKSEYSNSRNYAETNENTDTKSGATPDAPETPTNSWSPEIMDSGYPNSSSTQDTTPEYDLSSIAQDRISDSESPSIAEPPRIGFHEHANVENGDLANNNRDDEGNNMIAQLENNIDDDLQPLIDVLEDDIENENDIYAIENDFPVWLLGILARGNAARGRLAIAARIEPDDDPEVNVHAAGDAGMPDPDEGFDSTSSEYDNIEDASSVTTESSAEELNDTHASGDYY